MSYVVDVNGRRIYPDASGRLMPDDIDGVPTPQEKAVEIVERAAGCKGACYGAEVMCIEPEGAETDTSWAFVGQGRGGYNQVQEFNFVGEGSGSYDKGESTVITGWKLKPIWLGLSALTLAVLAGFVGFSVLSGRTASTTAMAAGQAPDINFMYDCAKDAPASWEVEKQRWCCKKFSKGCSDASKSAASPAGPHPPSSPPPVDVLYDCNAGWDKWEWGWSVGKKSWCCHKVGKGCKSGEQQQHHQQQEEQPYAGSTPVGGQAQPEILPYNCTGQDLANWPPGKTAWCCKHEKKGCPEGFNPAEAARVAPAAPADAAMETDCNEGLANWQAAWSAEKKAWCCAHHSKGCISSQPAPQRKQQ